MTTSNPLQRFACPICGFLTLAGRRIFDICDVCFWEDDGDDDGLESGPNQMTHAQGKENYAKLGAVEERFIQYVRPPLPEEMPK